MADVTYIAVLNVIFGIDVLNSLIENAHTSAEGPKEGPKHGSRTPKTTKNHRSLQLCNLKSDL